MSIWALQMLTSLLMEQQGHESGEGSGRGRFGVGEGTWFVQLEKTLRGNSASPEGQLRSMTRTGFKEWLELCQGRVWVGF